MSSTRRYAREIERRWATLLERPAVLGERDWSLICDWHDRGIPLALVQEAFEHFAEKQKGRRRDPRSLAILAPWIEEAWRTVQAGQMESAPPPSPPAEGGAAPELAWRRALDRLDAHDPLKPWLGALVLRLEAGADPAGCERELRDDLLERLGDALREELQAAVEKDLAAFRARMTPETWRETVRRGMLSSARRRLGLPALSGS